MPVIVTVTYRCGGCDATATARAQAHHDCAQALREAITAELTGKEKAAGPAPCPRCDGCGQLADTENREPWTAWTSLPLKSAPAVLLGAVKPVPCDVCGGTGIRKEAGDE